MVGRGGPSRILPPMTCAAQLAPRVLTAVRRPGAAAGPLGRTGTGKTSLLRRVAREALPGTVWCSAFELATQMADAIREGRYESCRAALSADDRPLYVEHLEDLRGKPRTRVELRSCWRLRPVVAPSFSRSRAREATATSCGGCAAGSSFSPWTDRVRAPQGAPGRESASQAAAAMMAPVTGR